MEKKVMSKQEILDKREELLKNYFASQHRARKTPLLCKKERKLLGIGKDCGKASLKQIRISPDKVQIVVNLIKGKPLEQALAILKYTPKAAAPVLHKLLSSAQANAVNNNQLNPELLYVHELRVGPGPIMKRWIPRGRGNASRLYKRTSRIAVVLKEKE